MTYTTLNVKLKKMNKRFKVSCVFKIYVSNLTESYIFNFQKEYCLFHIVFAHIEYMLFQCFLSNELSIN